MKGALTNRLACDVCPLIGQFWVGWYGFQIPQKISTRNAGEVIFQEAGGGSGHEDCGLCHLDRVDTGGHKTLLTDNAGRDGGWANIVPYPAILPTIDMPLSSCICTRQDRDDKYKYKAKYKDKYNEKDKPSHSSSTCHAHLLLTQNKTNTAPLIFYPVLFLHSNRCQMCVCLLFDVSD